MKIGRNHEPRKEVNCIKNYTKKFLERQTYKANYLCCVFWRALKDFTVKASNFLIVCL